MDVADLQIKDLDVFSLNLIFSSNSTCYTFSSNIFYKFKLKYNQENQIQFNLSKTQSFDQQIHNMVIIPEINLGLIHAGSDLYAINIQTLQQHQQPLLNNVKKIILHNSGLVPVPINIYSQDQANNVDQFTQVDIQYLPVAPTYNQALQEIMMMTQSYLQNKDRYSQVQFIVVNTNNSATLYNLVHEQYHESLTAYTTCFPDRIDIYQFHIKQQSNTDESDEELSYLNNEAQINDSDIDPFNIEFLQDAVFCNINLSLLQLNEAIFVNKYLIFNVENSAIEQIVEYMDTTVRDDIISQLGNDYVYLKFDVKKYIENNKLGEQPDMTSAQNIVNYLSFINKQRLSNISEKRFDQHVAKIQYVGPNINLGTYETLINTKLRNPIEKDLNQELAGGIQVNGYNVNYEQINKRLIRQSLCQTIKYVPGYWIFNRNLAASDSDQYQQNFLSQNSVDIQNRNLNFLESIQLQMKQQIDNNQLQHLFIAVPILISLQYQNGIEILDVEDSIIMDKQLESINYIEGIQFSITNGLETIYIQEDSEKQQNIKYFSQFSSFQVRNDQYPFNGSILDYKICFLPLYSYSTFGNTRVYNSMNIICRYTNRSDAQILNIVYNNSIVHYIDLLKQVMYSFNQLNIEHLNSSIQAIITEQEQNNNQLEQSYIYTIIGMIQYSMGNYIKAVNSFLQAQYLSPLDVIQLFLYNIPLSKLQNPHCVQLRYNFPSADAVNRCKVLTQYFKNIILGFLNDQYWVQISQLQGCKSTNYFHALGKMQFEQDAVFKKRYDNIYFQDILSLFFLTNNNGILHNLLINLNSVMSSQQTDDGQFIGKIKALTYYLRTYLDNKNTWTQVVRKVMKSCKLVGDFEYLNSFLNQSNKQVQYQGSDDIQLILRSFLSVFLSLKPFSIQPADLFLLFVDEDSISNKGTSRSICAYYLNNKLSTESYNDVFGILTLLSHHNLAARISSLIAQNSHDDWYKYIEFSLCSRSFGELDSEDLKENEIYEELRKLQITNQIEKILFWQYFPYLALHYQDRAVELMKQKFLYRDKSQRVQQQYLFFEIFKLLQLQELEYKPLKDKHILNFGASITYQAAYSFYQYYIKSEQEANHQQFSISMAYYFSKCIQHSIQSWRNNFFNQESPSWQTKIRFNWLSVKVLTHIKLLISQNINILSGYQKIYNSIYQNMHEIFTIIKKYYDVLNTWIKNGDLLLIQQDRSSMHTVDSYTKGDVQDFDHTDQLSITEHSTMGDVGKNSISQSNIYANLNDKSTEEEYQILEQNISIDEEIKHMIDVKIFKKSNTKVIKYIHYQIFQFYSLVQEISNISGCLSNQFDNVVKNLMICAIDQQKQFQKAINVIVYLRQQKLINLDKSKSEMTIVNNFIQRLDDDIKKSLQTNYQFNVVQIDEIIQQIYQLSEIYLQSASKQTNQSLDQLLAQLCEEYSAKQRQIINQSKPEEHNLKTYQWSPVYFMIEFLTYMQLCNQMNIISKSNVLCIVEHFLNINKAEGKLLACYAKQEMIQIMTAINIQLSQAKNFLVYGVQMHHKQSGESKLKQVISLNKYTYNSDLIRMLKERYILLTEQTQCYYCKQPLFQNQLSEQQELEILNKVQQPDGQKNNIILVHKLCRIQSIKD